MMKKRILSLFLIACLVATAAMADTPNERQARRVFDRAYQLFFGARGASLDYSVTLGAFYQCNGTIWQKGKKLKFIEDRICSWCDGTTYYRVDRKKKTVEVHNPNSPKKDKYANKFTFRADDFVYHVADGGRDFILTLDAKKSVKGYIRHVKARVDKHTYEPKSLKIKVVFFWATVNISNFKSGGIDDAEFVFPKNKFAGYTFTDKRPD